jgi:hypothetical protein
MSKKYNPFRPKSIVQPGMFSGRIDEIRAIEHSFVQTKNGNPQHFIVEGERGIGKSSLMLWAEWYARGDVKLENNESFNFFVVSGELHETNSLKDIIQLILERFRKEVEKKDVVSTAGKRIFDFVKRFEAFGVKYKEAVQTEREFILIDDLADMMADALNDDRYMVDGIIIFLDEADKPSSSAHLGMFCKSLTERLTKLGCDRVGIGLAGLPELMEKLVESHPSSVRVFETFTLQPLYMEERAHVINSGLEAAKIRNSIPTIIDPEAMKLICTLSEGYPHFLQQFAYSSFDNDTDGVISTQDVISSMHMENGALHQLGRKYFENILFVDIRSENYRKVLMSMADHLDGWVDRKTIKNEACVTESILNNALNTLKNKKILIQNERGRGEYRLPTKSFAVWLKAFGNVSGRAGNLKDASWAGFISEDGRDNSGKNSE